MSDYVTEYDRLLTRLTSPPRTERSANHRTKLPQTREGRRDTEAASTNPASQNVHRRRVPHMPPSTNDAPGRVDADSARPEPPPSPLLKDDEENFSDTEWTSNIKPDQPSQSSHDYDAVTEESIKKIEEEVKEIVEAMERIRRATPPQESQEDAAEGHFDQMSEKSRQKRIALLRCHRRASTEVQKAKQVVQHKAPPKAAKTKENSQPMQRQRSRKGSEPTMSSVDDDGEESMSDNPKIRDYARTHENAFFGMETLAHEKIWPAFPPPMRWSDKEGWKKGEQG